MKKLFLIPFLFSLLFVVACTQSSTQPQQSTVSTEGKQIVDLAAKGGYSPSVITAKADTPTVLRVKTSTTFDCSSALTIPSLGIQKNLPASGSTDIEIPPQKAGTRLAGTCSMGMYNFDIVFN